MRKALIISLAVASIAGHAAAFHPLITEDTGFLGKNNRQIETGFEHSVSNEGNDLFARYLGTELSYGITDKADFLMSIPWSSWTSGGASENGLGDFALESKFAVAEKWGWTLALKPGFSICTGDHKKGLGAGKSGFWTHAVAGAASGPWQYYINAGYLLNKNFADERENILKGSLAAAYEIRPKTLISLDLSAETNPDPADDSPPLTSILGLVWSPYEYLDLDAGVKAGLNAPADDLGFLAGITFRF